MKEMNHHSNSFLKGFILVTIDCLWQNVSVKSGIVDVWLEFEFKENVLEYNRLLPYHTRPRDRI